MSNYYPALLKARQAMGKLVKNKENPHFKSKYADLAAVLEVITDPLMDAGILLEQFPTVADGLVTVDTLLTHAESGESEGHSFSLPVDGRPTVQSVGSTLTYARRYALMAIFGLAPEDDDGNEASAPKQAPAQRKTAPPVQKAPPPPEVEFNGKAPGQPMPTVKATQAFHAMGTEMYGKEWDTKRAELVKYVTDGRSSSSKELTAEELARLCIGMDRERSRIKAADEAKRAVSDQPDAKAKALAAK